MHTPGKGTPFRPDQAGWVSQILGEEFWEQIQESLKGIRPPFASPGARPPRPGAGAAGFPPLDIYLTQGEIVISLALPGVSDAAHVAVSLAGGATAVVEAFVPPPPAQAAVLQRERPAGYVSRVVQLPVPAAVGGGARCRYDQGILEVRLPRAQAGSDGETVSLLQVDG